MLSGRHDGGGQRWSTPAASKSRCSTSGGTIYAVANRCSHANGSLAEGAVEANDGHVSVSRLAVRPGDGPAVVRARVASALPFRRTSRGWADIRGAAGEHGRSAGRRRSLTRPAGDKRLPAALLLTILALAVVSLVACGGGGDERAWKRPARPRHKRACCAPPNHGIADRNSRSPPPPEVFVEATHHHVEGPRPVVAAAPAAGTGRPGSASSG